MQVRFVVHYDQIIRIYKHTVYLQDRSLPGQGLPRHLSLTSPDFARDQTGIRASCLLRDKRLPIKSPTVYQTTGPKRDKIRDFLYLPGNDKSYSSTHELIFSGKHIDRPDPWIFITNKVHSLIVVNENSVWTEVTTSICR